MDESTTEGPPDGIRIGRVALDVADVDAVASFYGDVLGLVEGERTDRRVVLGAPGDPDADGGDDVITPLVVLRERPDASQRGRHETGLFHLALRVPNRSALADALHRIENQWELGGASDHLVSEALYCQDPEGNGIEVYCDRSIDEWPIADDGDVEMDTLPLDVADLRRVRASRAGDRPGTSGDTAIVPPGTTVGHVHLEVSDLPAAREFYVTRLGLAERARYGASASFLAAADYHHHVGLNTWNGRTDPPSGRGLAWWEWLAETTDELASVEDRLDASEATVSREDGTIETTDPDGIPLRVRVRGD